MTALARAIDERLKELGWQRKRLAHEWCEGVGNGSATTYETRLSKLLNDDQEGYDFLTDGRCTSLAAALGWPSERLHEFVEHSLRAPTLVLDPRVSAELKAFVASRHNLDPDAFDLVLVDHDPDGKILRERVRDTAQQYRNPIVVLAEGKDVDFYEGAGLPTSRFESAKPGYVLVACPNLFPRLPVKLFDEDGTPMVPDPEREERYRERRISSKHSSWAITESEERWLDAIAQADAEGRPPTFRMDWICQSAPDVETLKRVAFESALRRIRPDKFDRAEPLTFSYVWLRERQIMALASPDDQSVRRFETHHPVHRVTSFESLVEALAKTMAKLNPQGEGGTLRLDDEFQALEDESGIALSITMNDVRVAMAALEAPRKLSEGLSLRLSGDRDLQVRQFLDDVLAREFVLPEERAANIFLLQVMRSAPLVQVSSSDGSVSAIANVGAGRLIRLHATTFPGEDPAPIRMVAGSASSKAAGTFDGGNVRFRLTDLFDANLEGSVLRSVGRRRVKQLDDDDND